MTDEEIREYAKEILLEACASVGLISLENGKPQQKSVGLSAHGEIGEAIIFLVESEDGAIGFQCDYNTLFGEATTTYCPQPYIEFLIRTNSALLDSEEFAHMPAELIMLNLDIRLRDFAKVLVGFAVDELWESIHTLPMLAGSINKFLTNENVIQQNDLHRHQAVSEIIAQANMRRLTRIATFERRQIESMSAPQYVFCDVYDQIIGSWQNAKKYYTRNKNFPNCIETMKTHYKELPDDLIEQFAIPNNYDAQPARLAFEHTTRILNIQGISMSESSRTRYLNQSRKQRAQVSDADAHAALDDYFNYHDAIAALNERINEIIRTNTPDS